MPLKHSTRPSISGLKLAKKFWPVIRSPQVSIFILLAYPLWFMSPVLSPHTNRHLGVIGNDLNLTVEEAQALQRMRFPWSPTNFRDFPFYSSFWRIEHLVDVPQKSYYWLMTRIFEPTFVVNTYQLIGMFLTGVLVYSLSRRLGTSFLISIGAGICAQSLPVVRQYMLTGVAANQNALFPLLALIVATPKELPTRTRRQVFQLIAVLSGAFVTSAYQFNYTMIIVLLFAITRLRPLFRQFLSLHPKTKALLISCSLLGSFIIFQLADSLRQKTLNEYGMPYGVYSREDVFKDLYTLAGYIRPDRFHLFFPSSYWEPEGYSQQYGGFIFVATALLALTLLSKPKHRQKIGFTVFATLIFVILSLGRIKLGPFEVPAAREILRFVLIGNRRYAIAGMIAQILVVVLFAYVLDHITRNIPNSKIRVLVCTGLIVVGLIDINPTSRRFIYSYADEYAEIRKQLRSQEESAIYIAPKTERSKEFYVFDYPIFRRDVEVFTSALQDPQKMAQILASRGVKFALVLVDEDGESYIDGYIQNSVRFSMRLPKDLFVPVARDLTMQNTADDGSVERLWNVRLVEINMPKVSTSHSHPRLAQYVSNPILEVARPDIDRRDVEIEWSTSNKIRLMTEALPSEVVYQDPPQVEIAAKIQAPPGVSTPFTVQIQSELESLSVVIGQEPVVVRIRAMMYQPVEIISDTDCAVGRDPSLGVLMGRMICFGISEFVVLQNSK
ncbi:MAG: hypothetical protein EBU84_03810 [Actinobacteria bacterium]|nr:hypothetical protein [Actinomycetota bacterium]